MSNDLGSRRYILNAGQHPPGSKAFTLRDKYGATPLGGEPPAFADIPDGKYLVCVVYNDGWEAAAVAHDEYDYLRFTLDATGRPKAWLLIDKPVAERLLIEGPWL